MNIYSSEHKYQKYGTYWYVLKWYNIRFFRLFPASTRAAATANDRSYDYCQNRNDVDSKEKGFQFTLSNF